MKHVWRPLKWNKGDPAVAADQLAKIADSIAAINGLDPKDWARVLRVQHEGGATLSPAQIAAYRGALGLER